MIAWALVYDSAGQVQSVPCPGLSGALRVARRQIRLHHEHNQAETKFPVPVRVERDGRVILEGSGFEAAVSGGNVVRIYPDRAPPLPWWRRWWK